MLRKTTVRLIGCAFLMVGCGLLFSSHPVLAAPVPPLRVVNHATEECAQIFGGDECMDCFPPEGWEILGDAFDIPCPDGYTEVDEPGYSCTHFAVPFCCMEGHSGAGGDCANMVQNRARRQCTFVNDAANTELPRGWRTKPEGTESYDWVCPANYEWVDATDADAGGGLSLPCCSGALLLGPAALAVVLSRKPGRYT